IEIIETGELSELKEYEERFGIEDYSLLLSYGLSDALLKKIIGLSVKSVYPLLDTKYLDSITKKLTKGESQKILFFIEEFRKNNGKYLLSYGECLGNEIVNLLKELKGIQFAEIGGDIALVSEKISCIEIHFNYIGKWEYLVRKLKTYSRFTDIHSKIFKEITGKTKFGIPFVLKYIENHSLDSNVQYNFEKYIKGDLHSHSLWTDGIHSIEQMAQAAIERKYDYLAITDHSFSMRIAHGLSESQALSQIQEIREFNKYHEFKLLAGIEVDILADGTLDFSNEVLEQFDFVIAAVHSHLNQEPLILYNRLEKALSNPYVNIFAHPTSRLLGRPGVLFCERAPYNVGIQSIIDLCKKNNVALELNCFPERLDLNEKNAAMAIEKGVKISLGTDAHSLAHLCNIKYGIDIINKINAKRNMVLNTYSYEELISLFKTKRAVVSKEEKKICIQQRKKDFQYYFGNNIDIIKGNKKIIGIDLTGSEDKESGWAYMVANRVNCRRIRSDSELIESIKQYNPDIVSIDSPLAYPKGRCCTRKDCECSKYGIMRNSERMLRHFGITVYPCLIDSMVNLTTRGMRLAKILRNMGYTVIESYPGVAQDVLMIPRKGKTVEQFYHLKQGLASFGIVGDLIDNSDISHDEVDAVTSALVGYFYLNKQYVGLGNEEEDYLIIPRIQEELLNKRLIIGLGGETGAGKTTVAAYLQFKYGMKYFRYSKVIEQMYHVTAKEDLQKIGAKIANSEEKQRELTKYMIKNMEPEVSYVIDGLRHLEDHEELQKYFGNDFTFIYLECRYKNRYKRYNKLHFNHISLEQFERINDHKSERDIALLQFKSDYRIDNNKGFKDLRLQVDNVIKKESRGNI
ncbi:MAG: PHP domain-containing protein, partial [Lachnospiraceae bacterium]|nr:PHP domain-containing protein [Lachnospiraceae bacterium]